MEQSYDHVAMFHHGHGGMSPEVPRRDYFDDDWDYYNPSVSDEIWDYHVYPYTSSSKHFFVFIWTCRQGDFIGGYYGPYVYGMPYCWHHGVTSGDCFIGFQDASMPLTQDSIHYPYTPYVNWTLSFVDYVTRNHYTVGQALTQASLDNYAISFIQTELYQGYEEACHEFDGWPIGEQCDSGRMRIYGNSGIYLY